MALYDEYLTQAELQRWILDADVAWARIDLRWRAHSRPLLDQVRDSALIESYFPIYTTRLMRALWDQIDVTSVFLDPAVRIVQAFLRAEPISGAR